MDAYVKLPATGFGIGSAIYKPGDTPDAVLNRLLASLGLPEVRSVSELGSLIERLGPLLRTRIRCHAAWARLSHQASLEDLEQEVWARALSSEPRAGRDPRSWLGAIARKIYGPAVPPQLLFSANAAALS